MFYSEVLPKDVSSAAEARSALDRLAGAVDEERLANARLLVSELVANAIEHVSEEGMIELRVAVSDEALRIEVVDPGPGFEPTPRREGDPEDSGWGLHFLSQLADRWAVDRDGGARVWFELRAR
jgi:anti-sigma regulatory factor (Ser/Thr protein kinase)